MFGRRKIATLVAEFLGTGILTLLILSVQRSTIGVPFFVAAAAGITFTVLTFALASTSGALLNPALTLAMWTARKISTVNTILFVAVQLLGGWAAYGLYTYFVNQTLQPVGGHFTGRILVAEAVGAGIFAFGYAAAMYQRFSEGMAAAVAGLSLMIGMVAASSAAIGLLNPAVALGARAFVWLTYVLGPVVGAVIGVNLYGLLFAVPEAAVATAAVVTPTAPNTAPVAAPVKIAKPAAAKRKTTTRAAATTARKTSKPAAKTARKRSAAKKK